MIIIFFVFLFIVVFLIVYYCVQTSNINSSSKAETYNIEKTPSYNLPTPKSAEELMKSFKTTTFKIAGVTFKDGQKQRQTALRMLKFKDAPMDGPINFEFEQYDFEGKDAVRIIANDRILGNVPADIVEEFISDMTSHSDYDIKYKVYCGQNNIFGCEMTFTWK